MPNLQLRAPHFFVCIPVSSGAQRSSAKLLLVSSACTPEALQPAPPCTLLVPGLVPLCNDCVWSLARAIHVFTSYVTDNFSSRIRGNLGACCLEFREIRDFNDCLLAPAAQVEGEIESHLRFLRSNHYAALQLPSPGDMRAGARGTITDRTVKGNYRRLALRLHPGVCVWPSARRTDNSKLWEG